MNASKDSIVSLAKLMKFELNDITKIESQWQKFNLIQWGSKKSTEELWTEIFSYKESSGLNPLHELGPLAKCL